MRAWWKKPKKDSLRVESTVSAELVRGFTLIQSALTPAAGVVYYPACGYDRSPSGAWPASRVIYADIDRRAIAALQKANLKAVRADALTYDPGPVDILVMLNPAIHPRVPSEFVQPGGLVICNDYHGTATELRKLSGFELLGLVRTDERRRVVFDRTQPEQYWDEVQTDEELQNAPMSWGGVDYDTAARIVALATGKTSNVVAEYRRIRTSARAARPNSPVDKPLWFEIKGETFLLSRLPGKKGTADSLFVFRKFVVS